MKQGFVHYYVQTLQRPGLQVVISLNLCAQETTLLILLLCCNAPSKPNLPCHGFISEKIYLPGDKNSTRPLVVMSEI